MNLEDVIDSEYGPVNSVHSLQQDDWSLHGGADGGPPRFGKGNQLVVIGWCGKYKIGNKYYILKCHTCAKDTELHGEGMFRSLKGNLVKGRVPCGCAFNPKWNPDQYTTLCKMAAEKLGHAFTGFVGEWEGARTKIVMVCDTHGEWDTGNISTLINKGVGCPGCKAGAISLARTKPDNIMVDSFFASGAFHPDTKFWRSGRPNSYGYPVYWHMSCPECGELGESQSGNLQIGQRPCACNMQRQQEAYLNWVVDDHNNAVALKFGIANNSKQRVKQQNSKSIYEVRQYQVYTFPDVSSCKSAERECIQSLECGVIDRASMPDGYTETTSVLNLNKVRVIYEKWGGILQEEVE